MLNDRGCDESVLGFVARSTLTLSKAKGLEAKPGDRASPKLCSDQAVAHEAGSGPA